jgi:hypothetical protein
MSITLIYEITGYKMSRDYARLAELAKTQSIVCIDGKMKDVARTIYDRIDDNEVWAISSRGFSYVYAISFDDFMRNCKEANIEFIEPEATDNAVKDKALSPMGAAIKRCRESIAEYDRACNRLNKFLMRRKVEFIGPNENKNNGQQRLADAIEHCEEAIGKMECSPCREEHIQLRDDLLRELLVMRKNALRDESRLDYLLRNMTGDALRKVVGVLSDTSDMHLFRAAIDAAIEDKEANRA